MADESDISRVREEEVQRGRRPRYTSEKEKRRRLKSLMQDALRQSNRGLFQQVLIDLGQKPGSDEYERSMKLFEDYQRARR
jgi:hypothetical protein